MDDAEVRDFVSQYLPADEAYCPSLDASAQTRGVEEKPTLFLSDRRESQRRFLSQI